MAKKEPYIYNGVELVSVTTVLGMLDKSEALLPWAAKQTIDCIRKMVVEDPEADFESILQYAKGNWREVRDEAADIGSEIHDLIKAYIRHGRDAMGDYRKEVENGFLAFLEWEKLNGVEWLEAEKKVFDLERGCAGTMDTKARFHAGQYKGRVFIIDWKSSKAFYDGMGEQVAKYRHMDSLSTKIPADGCGVLRLDKETGMPEFKDFSDAYEQKLAFFHKLLEAYYLQKDRRLKNNPFTLSAVKAAARGKKSLAEIRAEAFRAKTLEAPAPASDDWSAASADPVSQPMNQRSK